jgi:hypothetical protein
LDTEAEGRLEGYYLNFWKGNYLVTLTGFDEDKETVDGLKAVARTIEKKIPSAKDTHRPDLVGTLPEKDRIAGSEKYFKGNLALYNSYPFSRQDVFSLREGVKGSYIQGHDIYVIRYTDTAQAKDRFEHAKKLFKADKRYKNCIFKDGFFLAEDERDTFIFIKIVKNCVVIVLGAEDLSRSELIAQDFEKSHI